MTLGFCVTREAEFLNDICVVTTLFYVIFSEWLESSIERDLGTCDLQYGALTDLAIHNFAFFKHCFYCKNRSLK